MLFFVCLLVCLFWVVVVGLFSLCSVRPYRKNQEGYNKSIDFIYYCMPHFFVYKCRTSRAFCLFSVVIVGLFLVVFCCCCCLLFLKDLKQNVYIYKIDEYVHP